MSTMRNSVMLIGRPTTDLQDGNTFVLYVSETTYNKTTQKWEDERQFFNCVCAPEVLERAKRGVVYAKQIALDGKLKTNEKGQIYIYVNDLFLIDRPTNE